MAKMRTNKRSYIWVALFLAAFCAMCLGQSAPQSSEASNSSSITATTPKEFVNGRWFNGKGFRPDAFYAVAGKLTKKKPTATKGEVETVDLKNGYVIPPLADGHNHFPESAGTLSWSNPTFLSAGVFYILNPNDIAELSNPIRLKLGTPETVDVMFAHGGFTSPGGHPAKLYQGLVKNGIYKYTNEQLEGRAFYSIASLDDINKKWPEFLKTNPDFVKLYLVYSETYGGPNPDGRGLRPEFIRPLTARAHEAGLRAGAHLESAADFHAAVAGGVDFIMHLPGYYWTKGRSEKDYRISDNDIRLAAKRHVTVETTIDLADDEPKEILPRARAVEADNLRRLKRAGVKIIAGTDEPPGHLADEIDDLRATGLFTNLELLRLLVETTPQAIFPKRRIGKLANGYDASFLVLASDPLQDISALKKIEMKVKQGEVLK